MNRRQVELVREDCTQALADQVEKLAPLRGSQLLVTGGTGFTGTWLAELVSLLNDQHGFNTRLTLVARGTDFFRATRPHLANRDDIALLKADVRHLTEIPRETNYVIHAAATPDTRFHSSQPIETLLTIAEGTAAVLRSLDRCAQFKMLLNLSSARVYGTQPAELDRVPETFAGATESASVNAAYAEGKRYGETLCASARSQGRLPVMNARPFTVMGPYQSIQSPWAASNFIRDAIAGSPIRILGDGQTVRSYLHGADMAFWYLRMLTSGQSGSTYNVGSPEAVRLNELAEKIAARVEPRPEIRLRTAPGQIASNRSVPDTRAAERDFGLKVRLPLDRTLERTILWNQLESA
jgi:nucleoside-diphosphate-sugar epimerase